jgi:peptidoglycan/xylan/chitin deacetylase (PgdA/CDA1 family)
MFFHIAGLIHWIPLHYLIKVTGQKSIFPFYHVVADHEIVHIKHLYKIKSVKQFESDLDFFLREFQKLDVGDLKQNGEWGHLPDKKGFLISFDDGLREFHDVIAPVLIRKGIPAICFLNTAFIDNKGLFYRYKASVLMERMRKKSVTQGTQNMLKNLAVRQNLPFDTRGNYFLKAEYHNRFLLDASADLLDLDFNDYRIQHQPYLTTPQIKTLTQQGFVFGAHSVDHPRYSDLTRDQQLFQTKQSMEEVMQQFKPGYRLFSFPFSDFGVQAGFFDDVFNNNAVDLTFGSAGLKKDTILRNIQRIPVEAGDFSASSVIYSEYLYYMLKVLFHKNTIRR